MQSLKHGNHQILLFAFFYYGIIFDNWPMVNFSDVFNV